MSMLTLYYAPGACSLAAHIALEEAGETYEARRVDLGKGEQKTLDYLKIHPLGRVPALVLGNGDPLTENTAILPYIGKRYAMWPADPLAVARALSVIGFFASTVHPAHAHISRPERYATDPAIFPNLQAQGRKMFFEYLSQIDGMLAGREWLSDAYTVLDPYAFTFYFWGVRREMPMSDLKHFTAHKDRMLARPAVQRIVADENVKV
jgi:glutathione S-transferase